MCVCYRHSHPWYSKTASVESTSDEEAGHEGAVTEAAKEMHLRLIFAYKEVVSENPKKPGIIAGIYHQIIFDRPKAEVVPWRH